MALLEKECCYRPGFESFKTQTTPNSPSLLPVCCFIVQYVSLQLPVGAMMAVLSCGVSPHENGPIFLLKHKPKQTLL